MEAKGKYDIANETRVKAAAKAKEKEKKDQEAEREAKVEAEVKPEATEKGEEATEKGEEAIEVTTEMTVDQLIKQLPGLDDLKRGQTVHIEGPITIEKLPFPLKAKTDAEMV